MAPSSDQKLAEMVRAAGHDFGPTIIREAKTAKLGLAMAFALVEQESGFKNIFGCDLGTRDTVPWCHQDVTAERVKALISHVDRGGVSNGVGLTQLTSIDFIKRAEKVGGAHKTDAQCRVGFALLHDLIARHGVRVGLGAYNGGEGNPNLDYADGVLALRAKWQSAVNDALKGAKPDDRAHGSHTHGGDVGSEPPGDAEVHRDLVLTTPFMKGTDIRALQKAINTRGKEVAHIDTRIKVDGEYGDRTAGACHHVAFALGLAEPFLEVIRSGVTKQVPQQLIRDPTGRKPEDRKRAEARKKVLIRRHEARKQGAAEAVKWARSQIGVHETPMASNWGHPVQDWITFTGYGGPVFWCGCFVAFAVVEKGGAQIPQRIRLGLDTNINFDAVNGANGFDREVSVDDAQAGDIITFDFRHIALCAGPTTGGMVHTIDGNSSASNGTNNNGGEVAEHRRSTSLVTRVARLKY